MPKKYCLDLISDAGLISSKPVTTHVNPYNKLMNYTSSSYPDIPAYKRLVVQLLYLITTMPDITFITQ